MNIFDKWDKNMDVEGLQHDVEEAENNGNTGNSYKEVPEGKYEVRVENIEIKECNSDKNNGAPMISVTFRIINGDYKNQCLFYNQLITEGWQIGNANSLLRSLDSGITVEFKGYKQYNQLLLDIAEAIDGNLEYLLDYYKNKKGFNVFKIEEVYDLD